MRRYFCQTEPPEAPCDWVGRASTDEELVPKVQAHVMKVHGMDAADFTPEFLTTLRLGITDD